MLFSSVLPTLLELVEEALKTNEEKGNLALQSMDELTQAHPEVWKGLAETLLQTVVKIVACKDFEDGTRATAVELGLSLATEMPAVFRKSQEATKGFIEALV